MILVVKHSIVMAYKTDFEEIGLLQIDEGGYPQEKSIGHSRHDINTHYDSKFDLTAMTPKEIAKLLLVFTKGEIPGSKVLASDIKKYQRATEKGVGSVRARTVRQAAWMLEHYFAELPHHTIFSEDQYGGKSYSGYFVADVDYHPERRDRNSSEPAHCVFGIHWIENDIRNESEVTLYRKDVQEMTCLEILAKAGYVPETIRLMRQLAWETSRYYEEVEQVGKQVVAKGYAVCDLDDAQGSKIKCHGKVNLEHFGETRAVIDIMHETDEDKRRRKSSSSAPDPYRWHNWNLRFHAPSEDEIVRHMDADEDTVEVVPDFEIPVHPLVPCFDLQRHRRLRVHVNNLTDYKYDKSIAKKLVLPDRDWKMINLLVDHGKNQFQDVIAGKGQSMNILASGKPGVGKTLTAEVFAEFKERPLYTVQCAQLGLNAEEVEGSLRVIMERANRWNAILLLDEADVYIGERGSDLNRNGIVGAFLRVLEYARCILFMTTNLSDSVDDAVASRCIACLRYTTPDKDEQKRIWRVIADINSLALSCDEIKKIVVKFDALSGRDIKNLLKLASFAAGGRAVMLADIEYAAQFKPTY